MHRVGDRVRWHNIFGAVFEGVIMDIDSNVLIVRLDTGKEMAVEGWDWEPDEESTDDNDRS